MAFTVTIDAPSRLHFGLVDLGGVTKRSFGGAGCFLKSPSTRVKFLPRSTALQVVRCGGNSSVADIQSALGALQERFPHACGEVEVTSSPLAHAGLGSKTAAVLASLKSVALGCQLDISNEELMRLSRRGGASGVGLHGFFEGGLIVDCGHAPRPRGPWLPSGAYDVDSLPLKVLRAPMPLDWKVHLMMPAGTRVSGESERDFFDAVTPLSDTDVLRSLASIWHGLVPSILSSDLSALRHSFHDISSSGLKRKEIEAQPNSCVLLDELRYVSGVAAGMSSLGPLVFVVSNMSDDLAPQLKAICDSVGAEYLEETMFSNHGFSVSY